MVLLGIAGDEFITFTLKLRLSNTPRITGKLGVNDYGSEG